MRSYQKATTYVCDLVEDDIDQDGNLNYPESTFADTVLSHSEHIRVAKRKLLNRLHSDYEESEISYYETNSPIGFYLAALAVTEPEFYDYCREICATNIGAGLQLDEPFRTFATGVLKGTNARPTKRSRPRKKNWAEKSLLWSITKDVVEQFDLKLTRNDDGASGSHSACDAVAEALTVCGRKTLYSEIKNLMVHPDNSRFRSEFDASFRIAQRWHNADAPQNALAEGYFEYWEAAAKADVMDILSTFPTVGKRS